MSDIKDLLGIGKILDVLANGCDWFAKPCQIKRIATAERECKALDFEQNIKFQLKQAVVDNAICDLKSIRQQRQLDNVVDIMSFAAQDLKLIEHVSENPVDVDWASRFFDYAKDCSDDKIKILWGKILAGETASPGTYNKRTLNVLHDIEHIEAQYFVEICPFVFDYYVIDSIFKDNTFPYGKMLSLMECGLFAQARSGRSYSEGTLLSIKGKTLCLNGPVLDKNVDFYSGFSMTDAGTQIFEIIQADSNRGYLTQIQQDLKKIYNIDTYIDYCKKEGL